MLNFQETAARASVIFIYNTWYSVIFSDIQELNPTEEKIKDIGVIRCVLGSE